MRRRWSVNENFLWVLVGIWGLGWIPPGLLIGALTMPCDRWGDCGLSSTASMTWPSIVFLSVWFGVVLVPAAVIGVIWLFGFAWRNRPRRIIEPVVTDLRELDH